MESFLEFLCHVVCDLTNAMERSVSDLRVRMLQVRDYDRNHSCNLAGLIDILANLGEGQDTCILVSPVGFVGDCVLNELPDKRQHKGVTNTRKQTVHTGLAELD